MTEDMFCSFVVGRYLWLWVIIKVAHELKKCLSFKNVSFALPAQLNWIEKGMAASENSKKIK